MVLPKTGGPDVFQRDAFEMAALSDGMVRLEVHSAGINWADVQQRLGLYPEAPKRPYAPGYEVAGTVIGAAKGTGYAPGDKVVAASAFGGYTSHIDVDPRGCAGIPDGLSFDEAAAVPVVWLTAHEALFERARIRAGESIVIHGGAGGVGLAAIALAKRAGAIVITTAGGPDRCRYLQEETAADLVIDYKAAPWDEQLLEQFGKVHFVMDPIGGSHLHESVRVLRSGGKVIAYGASATSAKGRFSVIQALKTVRAMRFSAIGFMRYNTGIIGLNMLPAMSEEPERLRHSMEEMMGDMAKGDLPRPIIAKRFHLDRVADAHRYLQGRQAIGKVLLNP